jgi:hypothetical protein
MRHLLIPVLLISAMSGLAEDGVYVRFRLREPQKSTYFVTLGGFIHKENWYLPRAVVPADSDKKADLRINSGNFTPWFDLKSHAGKSLHGRMKRAGGIAEFPNITAQFTTSAQAKEIEVDIELATEPDEKSIVKKWHTKFEGNLVSFLVSPNLAKDAGELELDSEMTARRLKWAEEASKGERHAPKHLLLQTQFWGPQRAELNLKEARTLSLLGFNVVGNMTPEVRAAFPEFRPPGHSHDVPLAPQNSREDVVKSWDKIVQQTKKPFVDGAPFNFQDEICARPPLGNNELALKFFRAWLPQQGVLKTDLGVNNFDDVVPIETPEALKKALEGADFAAQRAARRNFYLTSRYRQHAAVERLLWNTEELHKRFGPAPLSSTLVADHPYFGGTGLGMGMHQQNTTWGGWPLAIDWFEIARTGAVDFIGIEDWMGLQYMYGPSSTWEGFQLMGFQAAIFRSGSRGKMPIMSWITPSDERNLRLKAASSLCQGATNFFYWCYGPTATSTENYWSDLQGSYPGMTHLSRLLEFGEPALLNGKLRPTKVALLYSVSSDLWQPFGYVHMLERRGLYFALIHAQYGVDFLTEEDLDSGRVNEYQVLYAADPCIKTSATKAISEWVKSGGTIVGTCAAGSRNEFDEKDAGLSEVFGIKPEVHGDIQPCEYRVRGRLNALEYLDLMQTSAGDFGVVGIKAKIETTGGKVEATYKKDNSPAFVSNSFGNGHAFYFAGTPGISYIKDAKFVPADLAEQWPEAQRKFLTQFIEQAGVLPHVKLSHAVVEAGLYEIEKKLALVLANFTYKPIESLSVEIPSHFKNANVTSLEHGKLKFESQKADGAWRDAGFKYVLKFSMPLGHDDLIMIEQK